MITPKQKEWVIRLLEEGDDVVKREDPHKYSVYKKRIRDRIDREMEMLLWIADYAPHLLIDQEYEIQQYGSITHQRVIELMRVIKAIMPNANPQLVKYKKELGFE